MPWIYWVLIGLAIAAAGGGLLWLIHSRLRAAALKIKEEWIGKHGDRFVVVTGCGMVDPPNRVPGVLGLLEDRLLYGSLILPAGGEGELPLSEITEITWERSWTSKHFMARKYLGAKIIGVTTRDGKQKVFAIKKKDAPRWEEALSKQETFRGIE